MLAIMMTLKMLALGTKVPSPIECVTLYLYSEVHYMQYTKDPQNCSFMMLS